MICQKCNKQIDEDSKFCPYCGAEQDLVESSNKESRGNKIFELLTSLIDSWMSNKESDKNSKDMAKLLPFYSIVFFRQFSISNTTEFFNIYNEGLNKPYIKMSQIEKEITLSYIYGYFIYLAINKYENKKIILKKNIKFENIEDKYDETRRKRAQKDIDEDSLIYTVMLYMYDRLINIDEDINKLSEENINNIKKILQSAIATGYLTAITLIKSG